MPPKFLPRVINLARKSMIKSMSFTDRSATQGGKRFFITQTRVLNREKRQKMIDPAHQNLSVSRQCQILKINRSTFYYKKKPIKPEDLKLMELIDKQYLKTPTWGSRSMRNYLRRLGYKINRKRVQRLMRLMGLERPTTQNATPAALTLGTRYIPTCLGT